MSLQLVTTEQFNGLDCNFYRNMNDDILLTREQIGSALGYTNAQKAIAKLHDKHKDRLNHLSFQIKDSIPRSGVGELQDRVYYSERGVMEICRWSRQPKADKFMDWVWDIVEKYRGTKTAVGFETAIPAVLQRLADNQDAQQQQLSLIMQGQIAQQQAQQEANTQQTAAMTALTNLITAAIPQPRKPPFTRWMTAAFDKVDIIADAAGVTRKKMLHTLYTELQDTYGIDLDEYQYEFCCLRNVPDTGLYTMNTIGADDKLKQLFDLMLDTYLEQCGSEMPAAENMSYATAV